MSGSVASCANCGAPIVAAYCGACGHRADHHVLSIGEFIGEAVEVFTHADSRLWRTFVRLLTRPGYLTQQFIAGRRASYPPPFRLYIVLSVVFFIVVPLTASIDTMAALSPEARARVPDNIRLSLQEEIDASDDPEEKAVLRAQLQHVEALRARLAPPPDGADGTQCSALLNGVAVPAWLSERATNACERVRADNGRDLGHSLVHNLGRAMLVLLPLLALIMKAIYWRQKRLYVEHLLLLLHNHACVFLCMTVLLLATYLLPSDQFAGTLGGLLTVYIGWYLFESMRRVYGQGWIATFSKFCALTAAYMACALLMFTLAAVYSAATL